MDTVQQSPLRIEAMTLRGLGSYLHGGKLEIRPLTVLCGTNGSGKSTWFRMLKLLKKSLAEGRLPFALCDDMASGESAYHDYTNAFVKFEPERRDAMASSDQERDYGRLGTVGLHIVADADFNLDDVTPVPPVLEHLGTPADVQSAPQAFLWSGRCRRGMKFRIRISDATFNDFESRLPRSVELVIGSLAVRFEQNLKTRDFAAFCSLAFWPGYVEDDRTELEVGSFRLSREGRAIDVRGPGGDDGFDHQRGFCELAPERIRQLLDVVLRGVFWLGAIRPVQKASFLDTDVMHDGDIISSRSVGEEGQHTHALARRFAYNRMSHSPQPGAGRVNYRYASVRGGFLRFLSSTDPRIDHPLAMRIWQGIDEATQRHIRDLFIYNTEEMHSLATRLINESLSRRDLYDSSLRDLLGDDARALVDRGISQLDDPELERFNRLLIDAAFPDKVSVHPGPIFEMYYASWLRKLLRTKPEGLGSGAGESAADYWNDPDHPPCGFLDHFVPDDERSATFANDVEQENLNRYQNPLFGENGLWAAPASMSSGFHQIAPMVVQAGLMRANEVLCIENPEVHLHPNLQLDVAEFLIHQAKTGKCILAETHSDLVVRRVIRAILEEEIKQEAVRVHFADVDADSPRAKELGYASSTIESIEIDNRGRIQNWPPGFMDAEIREARRLLDIMYGQHDEKEGD